jgi:hypothetical protein
MLVSVFLLSCVLSSFVLFSAQVDLERADYMRLFRAVDGKGGDRRVTMKELVAQLYPEEERKRLERANAAKAAKAAKAEAAKRKSEALLLSEGGGVIEGSGVASSATALVNKNAACSPPDTSPDVRCVLLRQHRRVHRAGRYLVLFGENISSENNSSENSSSENSSSESSSSKSSSGGSPDGRSSSLAVLISMWEVALGIIEIRVWRASEGASGLASEVREILYSSHSV